MERIKVVDSIMGSGKTSAVITMVNRMDRETPVMFITPFLTECERFIDGCTDREIRQPESLEEFSRSKLLHLKHLVKNGYSIASTHALFELYTPEILKMIRRKGYVLIMDEVVDVVHEMSVASSHVGLLKRAGCLAEEPAPEAKGMTRYRCIDEADIDEMEETGVATSEFYRLTATYRVYKSWSSGAHTVKYYALIHSSVMRSFSCVYILTYMFEASEMALLFKIDGVLWERAYVKLVDYGNGYDISDEPQPMQEYVRHIPDLIHVHEDDPSYNGGKLKNGRPRKQLNYYKKPGAIKTTDVKPFKPSYTFFLRAKNEAEWTELKKNIRTYFDNMKNDHGSGDDNSLCMFSTYKEHLDKVNQKQYKDCFVPFNARATNDYADRCYLAYVVDIHPRPSKKKFFGAFGVDYPDDAHALSTMVQWIWRSRVRRGEEIWVYIPSKRMRTLLTDYLNSLRQPAVDN